MKYKHIAGYNYENNDNKIILKSKTKKTTLLERFKKGRWDIC